MKTAPPGAPRDPVVAAMERVLRVEREGLAALRQAEGEAQRILADARAQAAAIGQRVSLRISRLHAACLEALEREIAASAASLEAQGERLADVRDDTAMREAARRVAQRLTEET